MLDFTICTVSLWSYINQPDVLPNYLNCLYDPNAKVIWPSVAPISLVSNQSKATQGIGILSGRMTWTCELFKQRRSVTMGREGQGSLSFWLSL